MGVGAGSDLLLRQIDGQLERRRRAHADRQSFRDRFGARPHAHEDEPVTRDMKSLLYDYYGSDPYWGLSRLGGGSFPNAEPQIVEVTARRSVEAQTPPLDGGDHLQQHGRVQGLLSFTPWTATSATSTTSSPTIPAGRSAISSSRRGTGGRARSCSPLAMLVKGARLVRRAQSI